MLVQDTFTMIMKLINELEKNIVYLAPYTCPLYSFSNYGAFPNQNNVKDSSRLCLMGLATKRTNLMLVHDTLT